MNHLERIVGQTREEVARRKTRVPQAHLGATGELRGFAEAISGDSLSVIAEYKRRSPSAGAIREDADVEEVVGAYERGGAAALSVLTEGPNFGGSLEDLQRAREASRLPILRKDFTVDSYQFHEALAAGADAVLLIVAALEERDLRALHEQARAMGLDVLVEAHDERELDTALEIGARVVGINSRDLTTLKVDTQRTFDLIKSIPDGVTTVAESGFSDRVQLEQLEHAGFDAVLMGEALMRSPDIAAACRSLVSG